MEYLRKALAYRLELIARPAIRELRERSQKATKLNFQTLPEGIPLRSVEGLSTEGLPIVASVVRLVDFRALSEQKDEALEDFLLAQLEQRGLVLHNLSHAQRRMVKYFEAQERLK